MTDHLDHALARQAMEVAAGKITRRRLQISGRECLGIAVVAVTKIAALVVDLAAARHDAVGGSYG